MHDCSGSCVHHTNHASSQSRPKDKLRLLAIALILIGSFSLAELAVGLFSHSLALLADSGHLASDCFAIVLALLATWIGQKQDAGKFAPRNGRIEVLAALINGAILLVIALWIGWEALERLQSPPAEILSLPMLATATVGFGVNSVNIFLLHKDSHHDLNLRGVFLHILADAASSIGVILAAIAVWALGWIWADGAIGLFVSGLILFGATSLIIESFNRLFLASPES